MATLDGSLFWSQFFSDASFFWFSVNVVSKHSRQPLQHESWTLKLEILDLNNFCKNMTYRGPKSNLFLEKKRHESS